MVMLVSSENSFARDISRQLGRSFIYIRKSKGPGILHWGTQQANLLALDNTPLTLHFWDLLHKKEAKNRRALSSTPKIVRFRKIIPCSIVSNAFLRSIKSTPFKRPSPTFIDELFVVSSSTVSVLRIDRKPDWYVFKRLLSLR